MVNVLNMMIVIVVFSSFIACQNAAKGCIAKYNDEGTRHLHVKVIRKEINNADEISDYMDYEYYPTEKLTGNRRILLALSNFMKGKIDISLFVKAYHQIMLEESAIKQMPGEFSKEGLILAGLIKKNAVNGPHR